MSICCHFCHSYGYKAIFHQYILFILSQYSSTQFYQYPIIHDRNNRRDQRTSIQNLLSECKCKMNVYICKYLVVYSGCPLTSRHRSFQWISISRSKIIIINKLIKHVNKVDSILVRVNGGKRRDLHKSLNHYL